MTDPALIDDFSSARRASSGPAWHYTSDRVMGGVSSGEAVHGLVAGRPALQLRGCVSLDNNGGFVQMSLDLADARGPRDASSYTGLRVTVFGDGNHYAMNLRTTDLTRPWQSYRCGFEAPPCWQVLDLPFATFRPQRTDRELNATRLRRVGLIAIGEPGRVQVAIADLRFY